MPVSRDLPRKRGAKGQRAGAVPLAGGVEWAGGAIPLAGGVEWAAGAVPLAGGRPYEHGGVPGFAAETSGGAASPTGSSVRRPATLLSQDIGTQADPAMDGF